jgi:hypothetical protein
MKVSSCVLCKKVFQLKERTMPLHKKLKPFFIVLIFFSTATHSQPLNNITQFLLTPDSTSTNKTNWTVILDGRRTPYNGKWVSISGINSGISFGKKRNELTLGYYWVNLRVPNRVIDLSKTAEKRLILDNLWHTDLYYFNCTFNPYLHYKPRLRLSVPLEIGAGSNHLAGTNISTDVKVWKKSDWFIPVQAGIYAEIIPTRYLGLNFQTGYRGILKQKSIPGLAGPYYSFGITMYTYTLYKDWKSFKKMKYA